MSYVTGIVGAVPNLNKQAYIEHATHAARILKEQDAIRVFEYWGMMFRMANSPRFH